MTEMLYHFSASDSPHVLLLLLLLQKGVDVLSGGGYGRVLVVVWVHTQRSTISRQLWEQDPEQSMSSSLQRVLCVLDFSTQEVQAAHSLLKHVFKRH